jgi:hypothetical protein
MATAEQVQAGRDRARESRLKAAREPRVDTSRRCRRPVVRTNPEWRPSCRLALAARPSGTMADHGLVHLDGQLVSDPGEPGIFLE